MYYAGARMPFAYALESTALLCSNPSRAGTLWRINPAAADCFRDIVARSASADTFHVLTGPQPNRITPPRTYV